MCELIKTCSFCKQQKELKESHIIPKFVYDWVKDTSPTPYLRASNNVEKREQDGPKQKLLCAECELLFSQWEEHLSRELFKKIANYRSPKNELQLSNETLLAILSIFWRKLVTIDFSEENNWIETDKIEINNLIEQLRIELLENNGNRKIFIIPVNEAFLSNYTEVDKSRHHFERSIDEFNIRFKDEPHRFIAYFKLPFMYLYIISEGWGITEMDTFFQLGTSKLQIDNKNYTPTVFKAFIDNSLQNYFESIASMSIDEQQKIARDIVSNVNYKNTGAYKSLFLRNEKS